MNKKLEEVYDKMTSLQEAETEEHSGINIYCNTWGNYNEYGADAEKVNGGWKSLDDAVEWWHQMEEKGEEPFINDTDIYEEIPFEIGEGDYLPDLAEQINEYLALDEWDKNVIGAIMESTGDDYEEAKQIFDDGNYNYYDATDEYDLAEQVINELGGIKEALGDRASYYIDEGQLRDDIYYDELNYFREENEEIYKDENGEIDEDALESDFEDYLDNQIDNIIDDPDTYLGDNVSNYFDYEAYGRDLAYDFDITSYGSIMIM